MKSSYKIALLTAAVLSVIVVVHYGRQSAPHEAAAIEHQPAPDVVEAVTADVEPTPTRPALADNLRNRLASAGTAGSNRTAAPSATPAAAPAPVESSADDVPTIQLDGVRPTPTPAPAPVSSPASDLVRPTPPPPAPAAPAAPAKPATYTVKAGDTLSRIAVELYGSESHWDEIAKANPTIDPSRLKVGQVLKLPTAADLERAAASTDPAAAAPGDTVVHTVQPGDTLSGIAKMYYNDTARWRYLHNVNRNVIGSDPAGLKVGMKIKVPPAPQAAE